MFKIADIEIDKQDQVSTFIAAERLCCVIRFRSRVALLRLIVSQYGKF